MTEEETVAAVTAKLEGSIYPGLKFTSPLWGDCVIVCSVPRRGKEPMWEVAMSSFGNMMGTTMFESQIKRLLT